MFEKPSPLGRGVGFVAKEGSLELQGDPPSPFFSSRCSPPFSAQFLVTSGHALLPAAFACNTFSLIQSNSIFGTFIDSTNNDFREPQSTVMVKSDSRGFSSGCADADVCTSLVFLAPSPGAPCALVVAAATADRFALPGIGSLCRLAAGAIASGTLGRRRSP